MDKMTNFWGGIIKKIRKLLVGKTKPMALLALAIVVSGVLMGGGYVDRVQAQAPNGIDNHSGCDINNGGLPRDCIIFRGSGLHADSITAQGQDNTPGGTYGQYQVYRYSADYSVKTLIAHSDNTQIPGDSQKHGRIYTWGDEGYYFKSGEHACAGFYWHYKNAWHPLAGDYGACANVY